MKLISVLFLLALVTACDPFRFGYKKNPAYVLDEAFKSISNQDKQTFIEVTGKEVLCIYGNDKGLIYLKDNLSIGPDDISLKLEKIDSKYNNTPTFVGFWSYYSERYRVKVLDKGSKETMIETVVDCDFGTDGEKSDKLQQLKPEEYKTKECRAVKLMAEKFKPLPLTQKCEAFKVIL